MTVSISSDAVTRLTLTHAKVRPATTSRKETAAHVSLSSDKIVKQRRSPKTPNFYPDLLPPARQKPKPENTKPNPIFSGQLHFPTRLSPTGKSAKDKKSANRPTPLLCREVRVSS